MVKKVGGLGRGFDTLLPAQFDASILASESEKLQKLAVSDIAPDPNQPRREFDSDALAGLAASITRHGILQPIVVSPADAQGTYMIIAGERRWRAAQLAKLVQVPVIVRSSKEQERRELALIENVQRVDLSALEQAASFEYLHTQFNLKYEEIAERIGRAQSTVINIVRLLQLPESAATALRNQEISEGHARQILSLKDKPEMQELLLQNIIKNDWTVRQAERFVTSLKAGHDAKTEATERTQEESYDTQAIAKKLNTGVRIKRMAHGGRLEIAFKDDADLERLLELF